MIGSSSFPALTASALALTLLASPALTEPRPATQDPAKAAAGEYVLDKEHASLTAKVSHMGTSWYSMRFDSFDAHYDYDPARPEASRIEVSIDANSLDVGNPKTSRQFAREFLGADANPTITFVSTAIERQGAHGVVKGDLTFDGVTRPVNLDVQFNGAGPGLLGGHRMGFSATADIDRAEFGSKAWSSLVGDDVRLQIEVEFQRRSAAAK